MNLAVSSCNHQQHHGGHHLSSKYQTINSRNYSSTNSDTVNSIGLNKGKTTQATLPSMEQSLHSTKSRLSQYELELSRCLNGRTNEPLLKHYSCAWHKDGSILIHGRVYITCFHVCFYSNILGWETKLSISFDQVINITKQKTALVFANAITVTTFEREYFLTSFLHRNNAFRALQLVWKYSMKGIKLTKDELSKLIKEKKEIEDSDFATDDREQSSSKEDTNGSLPSSKKHKKRRQKAATDSTSTTPTSSADSAPCSTASVDGDYVSQHSETTLTEHPSDNGDSTNSESNSLSDITATDPQHLPADLSYHHHLHGSSIHHRASSSTTASTSFVSRTSSSKQLYKSDATSFIYNLNPALIINIIIVILIIVLLLSMLTIICKLCELDPNLKSWLPWQPWCLLVCNS